MRNSLLALALLLAGCAPAPKPTPEPMPLGNASQEAKITFADAPANPCATAERQRDQMLVNFEKLHEAFESLDRTNKQLVEALRKRSPGTSTTTIHPTPLSWRDTSATVTSVPNGEFDLGDVNLYSSKKDPAKVRFHYANGAWCNVWADEQGLHWEACK